MNYHFTEAAVVLKVKKGSISNVLNGKRKTIKKFTFSYVIKGKK